MFRSALKFLQLQIIKYLYKYKQVGFVNALSDVRIRTGLLGKIGSTRILLFHNMKISNTAKLIDNLDKSHRTKQIHLVLFSEDTSGRSYDTESDLDDLLEVPKIVKAKKPIAKARKPTRGSPTKKIKKETVKREFDTKVKVRCITIKKYYY